MWVVKLGGSLLGSPELRLWLDMLASQADGRVVIVPGGGMFADAVREAQRIAGYDDGASHRMALLAMEQFGIAMKSLQPALAIATSELEIAERSWQHRAVVWLPSQMVLADESVAPSWDVTSDSLSAWLADKIGAERLVLVKSVGLPSYCATSLSRLRDENLVDAAFPEFAGRLDCPIHVLGKSGHIALADAMAGGAMLAQIRR